MTASRWESFHLFRAEPWEQFLCEAVSPCLDAILDGRLADSAFFVRYWERGPHIRLRLRTSRGGELEHYVVEHFERFFAKTPSKRLAQWKTADWCPNDTVQRFPYEPEVARYGGPSMIGIAEEQFAASSRAVLACMKTPGWSYDRALGAAIYMHLIFAHSLGLEIGPALDFFRETVDRWCAPQNLWLRSMGLSREELICLFSELFNTQREQVVEAHRSTWEAVKAMEAFEQDWANRWSNDMRMIGGNLRAAICSLNQPLEIAPREIFRSLMHMTNNRLGIMNRDEAYLSFVMSESLREVYGILG
jgi:thiopeptide-type bacteriocin biosynthesis protein